MLSTPSGTMARMIRGVLPRGLRPLLAAGLAAVLLLSGCSDDGDNPESGDNGETTGGTPETEESPYLEGVPEGIELTAQGSELAVGDSATVAYEPRQDEVGALEITVTELVDADFKQFVGWRITPETKQNSPYFVHAKVTNVGDTDLGGQEVPLYAVDGDNKLIEASTFQSTFKPCPPSDISEEVPHRRHRQVLHGLPGARPGRPHRGELPAHGGFQPHHLDR